MGVGGWGREMNGGGGIEEWDECGWGDGREK